MPFDERLAQLRALFERTKQIYKIIEEFPPLAVRLIQPQANMLHLILPFSCEELKELQYTFATEKAFGLVTRKSRHIQINRLLNGMLVTTCSILVMTN